MAETMTHGRTATAADPGAAIGRTLIGATAWIEHAELRETADGWFAELWLSRRLAAARGEQQGLRDWSLEGALRDPGVLALLDSYVARVNARLDPELRITGYVCRSDSGDELVS